MNPMNSRTGRMAIALGLIAVVLVLAWLAGK